MDIKQNSVISNIMRAAVYHQLGVAPIERHYHDMDRVLKDLPPEEQRAMKRKFRKLWRQAAKQLKAKVPLGQGQIPTRTQKNNRKAAVDGQVKRLYVSKLIDKANDGIQLIHTELLDLD